MTSDQQGQFEHMWPALSVRLHRLLARKKVSTWLADDLVQETGLRLIRMWPQIDQTKPIWPLTATIALNLFRDELRRASGNDSMQPLPDSPSVENVEERGLARVELRAVGGALAQMPAPQRDAILADLSAGTSSAPLASSARMLRMRARRRLQHLMDHASVLGVALGVQMRRAIRELELVIGRVLPTDAERATAAAISVLAAVSFGVAVAPTSPSDRGSTRVAPRTSSPDAGSAAGVSFAASALDAPGSGSAGRSVGSRGSQDQRSGRSVSAPGEAQAGTDSRATEERVQAWVSAYRVRLTDDTYLEGQVEAGVVGASDLHKDGRLQTRTPGSFNCTVAPSHTGASCTASETGSESRGVRAEHRGEAKVAGHRVY